MTKNAYTIKQLQEKNSESHHEMGQLRVSEFSVEVKKNLKVAVHLTTHLPLFVAIT